MKSFGRIVAAVGVALSVCCPALAREARDKVPGDGMIPFLAITGRPGGIRFVCRAGISHVCRRAHLACGGSGAGRHVPSGGNRQKRRVGSLLRR